MQAEMNRDVISAPCLIGTPEGTEHYVERHELGLFTTEEMRHALTTCGLNQSA
jgi:hypothetical protein